ncbi:unnamed protein product [Orchesella dallaii]|uniref:Uncharacterized protein n=1 Tax=Orchesella dallaii TaxID=48710 RepID=A0ABP1RQ05_9HEXA
MASTNNTVTWTGVETILINHFRDSTTEFVWEEQSKVARMAFTKCIILQCVILNFDWLKLQQSVQTATPKPFKRNPSKATYEYILEANARILSSKKYSISDIFLISDSTFASHLWNRIPQITTTNFEKKHGRKYPSVIALNGRYNQTQHSLDDNDILYITPSFSSQILLFVSIEENDVRMGIVSSLCAGRYCRNFNGILFELRFHRIPNVPKVSMKHIQDYWERIHSNTIYKTNVTNTNRCMSLFSLKISKTKSLFLECEIYEMYFEYVNCTGFGDCHYIIHHGKLSLISNFISDIPPYSYMFPFTQYSVDYTFEVLLPRTHFFDANLTAFLSPFTYQIWLCMVTAILSVSIWLIFARKQCFQEVALWQFSSILEQDGNGLVNKKVLKGFTLTTLWCFLLFSMRQFYCSSLYSFMTAKMDPKNFPKSIADLKNRSDFDLVFPFDVVHTMTNIGKEPKLSRKLVDTYLYLFSKAFITTARFNGITSVAETLLNISEAKDIRVRTYEETAYQDTQFLHDIIFEATFNMEPNKVVNLRKFVSICQFDCVATMELFGKPRFIRKPFKPESLLRLVKFWIQFEPNIATFRFSRFLSSVVQAGLHDFANNHYEKFERLKLLDSIGELRKGELNRRKGFFSLTFLGGNANVNNQEISGDLHAFGGVFIVSALVLTLAMFVFMLEVYLPRNFLNLMIPCCRSSYSNVRQAMSRYVHQVINSLRLTKNSVRFRKKSGNK